MEGSAPDECSTPEPHALEGALVVRVRDLATVALGGFAVFLLSSGILQIVRTIGSLSMFESASLFWADGARLVAGLTIWAFRARIVASVARDERDSEVRLPDVERLLAAAFAATAVVLTLVEVESVAMMLFPFVSDPSGPTPESRGALVSGGVTLFVSALLFFQGPAIARAWVRFDARSK